MKTPIRLIPVIDLKDGLVVHAVAGKRKDYRMWRSPLCPNARPHEIARALAQDFGAKEVYVADLDAIAGGEIRRDLLQEIGQFGLTIWLDSGAGSIKRVVETAETLMGMPNSGRLVVGLESIADADVFAAVMDASHSLAVPTTFSLDLQSGKPLVPDTWTHGSIAEFVYLSIQHHVTSMIVLDLACVGTRLGITTKDICQDIRRRAANIELICGGGVRHQQDITDLTGVCDAVLVATALHDGTLTSQDFQG